MKVISRGRASIKSTDFSRMRQNFQGMPANFFSAGVVGHLDLNPGFARIENGKVLVEVTLIPSQDEIICELLDPGGGDAFSMYMPVQIGMRVVIAMPQGDDDNAVIVGKLNDSTWPFPDDVAGIPTNLTPVGLGSTAAPQFAFMKTPDGSLLAIESGDGGDIVIQSGASIKLAANPGGQALVTATETHLGADFTTPPVGASTGPAGEVIPGVPGTPYIPLPGTNLISPGPELPPIPTINPVTLKPFPADGLVRFGDSTQSNSATDPLFWQWIAVMHNAVATMAAAFNVAGPLVGAPGSVIPPGPPGIPSAPVAAAPDQLNPVPASSSRSTSAD